MKIAFIGIGNVGFAIANRLQKLGHDIIIASNNESSDSAQKALVNNASFKMAPIQEAIDQSDLTFLATPFQVNQSILKGLRFSGKTLVDCTNPVGAGITHGLKSERSGSEAVQEWAPDAKVVKAFTIYGFENLINNSFPGYNINPLMLIAGNDIKSKELVSQLAEQLGFYVKDTGQLDQALHLEHMTLLWVKMVRVNQHHRNFVWGYLEREN